MRLFPHPKKVKSRLREEFKDKSILDLRLPSAHYSCSFNHDLKTFPWPIENDQYDLIICEHVVEHLPDTAKTLEELNRICKPKGKVYIETPHYTWFEAYRHFDHHHHFSFGSFDYFLKGNPSYKTDFQITEKYIFFDDLTYFLGIGFLANLFPRFYEKRFAFMFPATSFHITFSVEK